jgi:hypothetical protein
MPRTKKRRRPWEKAAHYRISALSVALSTGLCHLVIMAKRRHKQSFMSLVVKDVCGVCVAPVSVLLLESMRHLHWAWLHLSRTFPDLIHPSVESSMFDPQSYKKCDWSGRVFTCDFTPAVETRLSEDELAVYRRLLPIHIGILIESFYSNPNTTDACVALPVDVKNASLS